MTAPRRFLGAALLAALVAGCAAGPPPVPAPAASAGPVRAGLDVLAAREFAPLRGKRVGLVTNHSALDGRGRHAIDVLQASSAVTLVRLFSPEHGLRGTEDRVLGATSRDARTGLPVHSLYGKDRRRPTAAMLAGLDALVFDVQDVGVRFYTYGATLGLCLEAAAEVGLPVVVLDRPNPLGGHTVEGPLPDADLVGGFTCAANAPVVHGLTIGELGRLLVRQRGLKVTLTVVPCAGWRRGRRYDETGLPWTNPSPNLRSLDEELLYPAVALVEAEHALSVGRGTDRPFEYVGAPWLDAEGLATRLRGLPGLWATATPFVPSRADVSGRPNPAYPHAGEVCQGVRLVVTDRDAFQPVRTGLHLLSALLALHPDRIHLDRLRGLVGSRAVLDALARGEDPDAIADRVASSPEARAYRAERAAVLLYE